MHPLLLLLACAGPGDDTGGAATDTGTVDARVLALSPLPPVPPDPTNAVADDPDAAWLGRWLYYDTRLSASGEHSCATCHDPARGFGDGLPYSQAAGTTPRHAPTVLNAAHNAWQFWDGRADTLWMQALGPIEDPREQATSRLAVAHLVHDDAALRAAYEAVFGAMPDLSDRSRFPDSGKPVAGAPTDPDNLAWEGMDPADQDTVNRVYSNLGKAIAAYERLLVRGDAPFDTWVQGLRDGDPDKLAALSDAAVQGLELYLGQGNCHFCHAGPTFTTSQFNNIGLAWVPGLDPDDLGRYDGITALLQSPFNGMGPYSDDPAAVQLKLSYLVQGPEQLGQFKVPSLRNVAETAPYMHGGQLSTLREVVEFYNELEQVPEFGHREDLMVPLEWGEEELDAMVAFLEALTGAPLDPTLLGPPDSPVPPGAR